MDFQLSGKRALVTGASGGIGAGIAKALAAEGVKVVVHGRDRARSEATAQEIAAVGGQSAVAIGDLTRDAGARTVADTAVSAFGGIDILVNNAGGPITPNPETWFDITPDEWVETWQLNTVAVVRLVQALAPAMKQRGWGRIVNISSGISVSARETTPAYGAAKAGINNLTSSLSKALANSGVTVNAIMPGLIRTPMLDQWLTGMARHAGLGDDPGKGEELVLKTSIQQSVNRIGRPGDIAWAVLYLASPHAEFVTGSNMRVDGGGIPGVNN